MIDLLMLAAHGGLARWNRFKTRENPRCSYRGQVFETPWDDIHNAYFTSYALWTYLTVHLFIPILDSQ
jgi:hypothetical protein